MNKSSVDVREFIDPVQGLISGEIFTNEEIYKQELEHTWSRSWVFLAHESMIPKAGDYMQNYIGEDPILVVRQKDGSVRAFLNQCQHRGMRLCRYDRGNAKNFQCTFHGWTYDIGGNLTGVPCGERSFNPADIAAVKPHLVRLHNYKGFIFGTWAEDAPDFLDYIGDFVWMVDSMVDRYEGWEVVGVHRWVIPSNWKFNAEQPASDAYHAMTSHISVFEAHFPMGPDGRPTPEALEAVRSVQDPTGYQVSSQYGHGGNHVVMSMESSDPVLRDFYREAQPEVERRIGKLRATPGAINFNLFPNFMVLSNNTFRVTHPRGASEMEIWAWSLAPKDASDEVKDAIRVDLLRTFSPSGMFEQDDAINWEEEQVIMRGYMARKRPLLYKQMINQAGYDIGGIPGKSVPYPYGDEGARGMYQHYLDLMSGSPWPELIELKKAREAAERSLQGSGAEVGE